jgi:3,4-dihydroxy 2-butanone 4-phosphate synthase/GTP cyclohydrolase II
MHSALQQIAQEGRGIFVYLPQEGRGIGLAGKLQAYLLQEQGYDTLEANERLGYPVDARNYDSALEILRAMGIKAVRLLTNNPDKIRAVRAGGMIVESVPLQTTPTASNLYYLQTKQQRLGHRLFPLPESE